MKKSEVSQIGERKSYDKEFKQEAIKLNKEEIELFLVLQMI